MEHVQGTEENSEVNQEKTIDVEALAKRVEQLESSNGRLLDESKSWKEKYQGLRTAVDKDKEAKLTEDEQWKELVEIEKNKRFELESKVKNLTTVSMQKDLQYKVASFAKDAHNIDDVVTAVSKTGLLNLDKEAGSITGIEEAYNKVRQDKPYLFNTAKVSGMSAGKPDTMIPKEKTVEEQLDEDASGLLANVLEGLIK